MAVNAHERNSNEWSKLIRIIKKCQYVKSGQGIYRVILVSVRYSKHHGCQHQTPMGSISLH